MTKFRATSIALFLTIAALALGACGDDEGSNDSATTGADATQTTTGTTDTGTTEAGTTTRERTGKTETQERTGDDKGGSKNSGKNGSNSGSGSSGSGGGGKDSSPEKELTGKNVFSTSKTVCNSFLPTQLAKDLEEGKKSAEDIASDYARGYPSAERKQAHDGCLAGLKAKG